MGWTTVLADRVFLFSVILGTGYRIVNDMSVLHHPEVCRAGRHACFVAGRAVGCTVRHVAVPYLGVCVVCGDACERGVLDAPQWIPLLLLSRVVQSYNLVALQS